MMRDYHGMTRTPTYRSWQEMKARCNNKNKSSYARYGGRGIKVCDSWMKSFSNFLDDMGERPDGTTIDRIDNDGNYELSNCQWSTAEQQVSNRDKSRLKVSSTGIRYIYKVKNRQGYTVSIYKGNRNNYFGYVSNMDEALKLRDKALKQLLGKHD